MSGLGRYAGRHELVAPSVAEESVDRNIDDSYCNHCSSFRRARVRAEKLRNRENKAGSKVHTRSCQGSVAINARSQREKGG